MKRSILRFGALALVISLSVGGTAVAQVKRDDRVKARGATRFLSAEQRKSGAIVAFSKIGSTADAVVSLVAARREPRTIKRALRFLANHSQGVDTIGEVAKVHMALVAAGKDPVLGDRNLTEELKASQQTDGAYGAPGFDQVYSHVLAMLALSSAGEPADGRAVQWLKDAQCADGGWQYDNPSSDIDDLHCNNGTDADFSSTDSNTTALAVQALASATGEAPLAADPFEFFEFVRDEIKGGWGYTHGFTLTDANSTALVIQAYAAEERALPKGAKRGLRKLQYNVCSQKKKGAFAYSWSDDNGDGRLTKNERTGPDVGATVAGILGLLEKPLPIAAREVTKEQPKPVCGAPRS